MCCERCLSDLDEPSTASSRLASSNTMKGAFPPASKDTLDGRKIRFHFNVEHGNLLLECRGGHTIKQLRDRGRSSEGHFLDGFVFAHFFADLNDILLGSDDINDARWDSSTVSEL